MANTVPVYIRVHPIAPKRGYRVRRYNIYGMTFDETHSWYKVSFTEEQLVVLRSVKGSDHPDAKPVFDICTPEEKAAFEKAEQAAKEPKVEDLPTIDLTTAAPSRVAPVLVAPVVPVGNQAPVITPSPVAANTAAPVATPGQEKRKPGRPVKKQAPFTLADG